MNEIKSKLKDLEEKKMKNNVKEMLSARLKRGICCHLQSEGYIDTDQLAWLLNEIKDE